MKEKKSRSASCQWCHKSTCETTRRKERRLTPGDENRIEKLKNELDGILADRQTESNRIARLIAVHQDLSSLIDGLLFRTL